MLTGLLCVGAHLDPTRVLDALAEDMPLAVAVDTLARMMRERLHRRRQGQVVRNLHRAVNLAVHAEKGEVSPALVRLACACCSFLLMLLLVHSSACMLNICFKLPMLPAALWPTHLDLRGKGLQDMPYTHWQQNVCCVPQWNSDLLQVLSAE